MVGRWFHNWIWELRIGSRVVWSRLQETKAKQEELGSSLAVDELAEGDDVDVAIPS